jgi:hypothetical protein
MALRTTVGVLIALNHLLVRQAAAVNAAWTTARLAAMDAANPATAQALAGHVEQSDRRR